MLFLFCGYTNNANVGTLFLRKEQYVIPQEMNVITFALKVTPA
jgi:hypothetical protein